jgi:hypothetical protein
MVVCSPTSCLRPLGAVPLRYRNLAFSNFSQGIRYAADELALYSEYIVEIALIRLCPKVTLTRGIDQLCCHTNAVDSFLDASFQHIINA